MAGDRARVSYDASRKWRGLIAQQGRVTVEADWNEADMIAEERDRQVALDVVGRFATPDRGYAVRGHDEDEGSHSVQRDLTIGRGTLYVGGERLDLAEPVLYSKQPDWLDHSTDPIWAASRAHHDHEARHELVYLLGAEQEVSAVEDPALADVALGGPDTMQRRRILQRFVRCQTESDRCEESWDAMERSLGAQGLKFKPALMTARSAARLRVSGSYLGAENQMIRVMVTRIDSGTGEPTIVWGFDDASFLYRVQNGDPHPDTTTLTLASAPVDSYHYPRRGQVVELLRDAVRLTDLDYIASPTGLVTTVTRAYNAADKTFVIAGSPAEPNAYLADYLCADRTPQPYVRVWEETAHAPPGEPVRLGDTGVCVTLSSADGFHVGDFWHFALRPAQPASVYPERYRDLAQPPDGPRTWACPLAVVTWRNDDDEDAHLIASSCVPKFSGLAELDAGDQGCWTLEIRPEQVDGGASLQAFLHEHARRGPLTVCMQPGTYTLPTPLRLGPELDGITLQACRNGVVLQGPHTPKDLFAHGLITIRDAESVTIRGIELSPPQVRITPPNGTFSGLHVRNRSLLRDFTRSLELAIGISAHNCVDLTIEDCFFGLPDPGRGNSFGAGILATGAMIGATISNCTFRSSVQAVGFHDIARGSRAKPLQLTFGYLQVPTFSSDDKAPQVLDEAAIEHCLFEGITVPGLMMAHLGKLLVSRNTVRFAYGGFWLLSLAAPELSVMFDRIAIGDAEAYQELSEKLGGAALLDRILVIATAIGQVYPATGPVSDPLEFGRPITADRAPLGLVREAFARFYLSAELPPAVDALLPSADSSGAEPTPSRGDDGEGWRPRLRLDLAGCQIDATSADSFGGAGLLVADFTAGTGASAFIHDNTIRSRFPGGEAVFVGGVAQSCVTGNVVANEVVHDQENQGSHSMGLSPATEQPAVAVTGNVFICPPRLPERKNVTPAFRKWDVLNTVLQHAAHEAGESRA